MSSHFSHVKVGKTALAEPKRGPFLVLKAPLCIQGFIPARKRRVLTEEDGLSDMDLSN